MQVVAAIIRIVLVLLILVVVAALWVRSRFRDPCPDADDGGCRGRLAFEGDIIYQGQKAAAFRCTRCRCRVLHFASGRDVIERCVP